MNYIEIEEVDSCDGIKIVLTKGMPGPWGELVKAILGLKQLSYTGVAQYPGASDEALLALSGQTSAPVLLAGAVCLTNIVEIISYLEKQYPSPKLFPSDPRDQQKGEEFIGLIVGRDGFAWSRRLMLFKPMMELDEPQSMIVKLAKKYGYSKSAVEHAPRQTLIVLARLAALLNEQQCKGSHYFFGQSLTVLDICWAVFSSMLQPLPQAVNAMPDGLREAYTLNDNLMSYVDPILLKHRDFIYKNHLVLPLDY